MFSRLICRYLVTSVLPSFPGFTMGIIIELFHCLGKCPFRRHPLYISVKTVEKRLKISRNISLLKPSSPGALLGSNFSNTASIILPCKFYVVKLIRRFCCQMPDVCIMSTVASLSVFGYEMFHHVSLCSLCPMYRFRFEF